ncbi:response regulator transcription factor [Thalassospira sp.]|uniref:response regulator transcription factor n=1 Tax=Thalassospira sp. TaxID=1912094 RepID=UPI002732F9B0|nr:response regulator transcription factor [Thalassospira sp.]MDP2700355.1 response regulator transcription factor [Thalassospira sp.]
MTRILLIDDDAELGAMLAEYLDGEGFAVSVVYNGQDGIRHALSGDYAAVLLDIMMPGIGGIEVLRQVRGQSMIPVIMLTAKGDDVDRVVGLELGADDYIPKPYYPRELVARLRAVLRRVEKPAAGIGNEDDLIQGPLRLNPARRSVYFGDTEMDMTVSEFNLLEILIRAQTRVLSKNELSMKVLGRPREVYDRSIDVHMSNLRQKLHQVSGDAGLIETVRGFGYRLRQDI